MMKDKKDLEKLLRGVIVPLITPLTPEGKLDRQGLKNLITHVLSGGVHAIFVLGSTGEAVALSEKEKKLVIQIAVEYIDGKVPVLAGISDTDLSKIKEKASFCCKMGVDAVVLHLPYYFPLTDEEIFRFFKIVAEFIQPPILLYNIPSMTKLSIPVEKIVKLSREKNIIGIKDSSGDMSYFQEILNNVANSGFLTFVGREILLAEAVLLGANGAVAGGANVAPRLFVDAYEAAASGNLEKVKENQKKIMDFSQLYTHTPSFSGYLRGIKSSLEIMGICSGSLSGLFIPTSKKVREKIKKNLKNLSLI